MKNRFFFVSIFACLCLAGCSDFNPFNTKQNALIIKPSPVTRADNGVVREDGSRVYRIESFWGGGSIPSPDYSVSRFNFYEVDFSSWSERQRPLVTLHAIYHSNINYSHPGEAINEIWISGIDESLGFGSVVCIRLNQGNYEGATVFIKDGEIDATESIKSVIIKSFKLPQVMGENMISEDDAEINIVITSKTGGTITLIYSGVEHIIPMF